MVAPLYKIISVQSEDDTKSVFETFDIVTLQDNNGVNHKVPFGFYQNGEAFWFPVANYEEFVRFINTQSLPKDYDITDTNNIQDLIHTYEDTLDNHS